MVGAAVFSTTESNLVDGGPVDAEGPASAIS
jgi:hypothetical protein